jgi:hypothetical protein
VCVDVIAVAEFVAAVIAAAVIAVVAVFVAAGGVVGAAAGGGGVDGVVGFEAELAAAVANLA